MYISFARLIVYSSLVYSPPIKPIASAVRSDCVRRPIRLRPPSDQIASAAGGQFTRLYSVKYVIKNAPSVILSDRRLCFLSAKDKTFSFWHTICISVSENINQLK